MDRTTRTRSAPDDGLRRRWVRALLRLALVIAIAATAVVTIWRWSVAWVPAVLAAVIYCMDLVIWSIDRRARSEEALGPGRGAAQTEAVLAAEERIGRRTAMTIAGGLAAIAVVVAAAFLDWQLVGIGAMGIFAYLVLIGLPVWAAAVEEEIETEHDQLTGESRSIH